MSKELTGQMGIVLTWEAADSAEFWHAYQKHVSPVMSTAHAEGAISLVLPFEHKPLRHPNVTTHAWTNCVIALVEKGQDVEKLGAMLIAAAKRGPLAQQFRAADLMCVQQEVNMVYAANNGLEREHNFVQMIEFVFSDPEARQQYYEDQYAWSGPVMRKLHEKDRVGRFLGFEMERRLASSDAMTEWDVMHVVSATRWQIIKAVPTFHATWTRHAKKIWGPEMTFRKKVAEWEKIRLNIKSGAKQKSEFTLQAPADRLVEFI